jgi:hypothetical protein
LRNEGETTAVKNNLSVVDKALAFTQGLLCEARKLTRVACLRRDPLVPELHSIERVASQTMLACFFTVFDSAGANLCCFRPLWQWELNCRPSHQRGDTLDLDSPRLLQEDDQQEGAAVGYNKRGLRPCLHLRSAVVAEARLAAQLWLRPGNALRGNNWAPFFLDLWENRPHHLRLGGVRADSGFCLPEHLASWEQLRPPHVVVAQLSLPIQRLLRSNLVWTPAEALGMKVAAVMYQGMIWPNTNCFGRAAGNEKSSRAGGAAARVLVCRGLELFCATILRPVVVMGFLPGFRGLSFTRLLQWIGGFWLITPSRKSGNGSEGGGECLFVHNDNLHHGLVPAGLNLLGEATLPAVCAPWGVFLPWGLTVGGDPLD